MSSPRLRAPRRALPALCLLLALAACAAPPGADEWDPWEGFNRKMFWFNEHLDRYVLEPAAEGWESITTSGVRESVRNFESNLLFPMHFVNNLLEFRLAAVGQVTARFVINSTIGMLGFFDPASVWGIPAAPANFGQTLAVWGFNEGPYLMLPFLGPSDPRDTVGFVGDFFIAAEVMPTDEIFLAIYVVTTVNWRAVNLDNIREAREAAIDYYAAVRSAWLDNRRRAIGIMAPPEKRPATQPTDEEDPYDVDAAIKE